MNVSRTIVLVAAAMLAGCVTTETGDVPIEKNAEEAAQINMELGVAYLRGGNYERARTKLESAIEDDPGLATAHSALGLVYEQLGDMKGAEREYRQAVKLDGEDPDTLNALGVFLCLQKNEPEEALKYFEKAMQVPLYQNRGMLYRNAGVCARKVDLEQAENYFRRAFSLSPTSTDVLLQLSDVALQQGNFLQSRGFLERYITAAGVNPTALWLGVQVETALGDIAAADGYGQRLKSEYPTAVETRLLLEKERDAG